MVLAQTLSMLLTVINALYLGASEISSRIEIASIVVDSLVTYMGVLFLIASDAMLHKPAYTAGVVYACIIFVVTAQFMSRRAFTKAEEQSILFTPFDIPITVQAMRALLISAYQLLLASYDLLGIDC